MIINWHAFHRACPLQLTGKIHPHNEKIPILRVLQATSFDLYIICKLKALSGQAIQIRCNFLIEPRTVIRASFICYPITIRVKVHMNVPF